MFLSSLTIILPSMTTFFNLFAALNGYYFCFCLFYIAMVFFVLFLPCCEFLYLCFFSGFTSFLSLLSIRFIPCLWFLFCVSVCL